MPKNQSHFLNEMFGQGLPDVKNIGLMHFDPIWAINEHSNNHCELLHIVAGDMELVTPTFRIPATTGDTLLIPANMPHRDEFEPDRNLKIFYVSFEWSQEVEYFKCLSATDVLRLSIQQKAEIKLLFDRLRGDISGSTAEDRLMARVRVLTILLLIMKGICKTPDNFDDEHACGETLESRHRKMVTKAKQYMQKNLSEIISLDDIALHLGVSSYHLSHVFSSLSDFTVYSYLMTLRMEKARNLLKEGSLNVSEVAYAVGYQNPDYFSRVYKKHYGHLPSTPA